QRGIRHYSCILQGLGVTLVTRAEFRAVFGYVPDEGNVFMTEVDQVLGSFVGTIKIIAANRKARLPFKYRPPGNVMCPDLGKVNQLLYVGNIVAIAQKDNPV